MFSIPGVRLCSPLATNGNGRQHARKRSESAALLCTAILKAKLPFRRMS
jgi:hypothetical protein